MSYPRFLDSKQHFENNEKHNPYLNHNRVYNRLGIYFCSECNDLAYPHESIGPVIHFYCNKCAQISIDFRQKTKREETLLYVRQQPTIWSKKKTQNWLYHILDPLLPRMNVKCPQCGFGKAIYLLESDSNESKLVAKMMCANAKGGVIRCGNVWELPCTQTIFDDEIQIDLDAKDSSDQESQGDKEEKDQAEKKEENHDEVKIEDQGIH